jgi:aminoglycoside phosphotransferase (APT) family kinase protein
VARMFDTGLSALAGLHRVDWRDGFEFLDRGRSGHALASYLVELEKWWEWSEPSRQFAAEELEVAYRFVLDNPPDDPAEGIVWGDARVGNLMYDDDLNVVAMLDWETATLGPPGVDLGWWLMFEDFLSEAQNKPRLAGSPNRAQMISRYEELAGRPMPDIDYYELLACVVMSLINSKLGVLLRENQGLPDEIAGNYARRTVKMAGRRLDAIRARA